MVDSNVRIFKESLNPYLFETKLINGKNYRINPIKQVNINYIKKKDQTFQNLQKYNVSESESEESGEDNFLDDENYIEDPEINKKTDKLVLEKLESKSKPENREFTQFTHYFAIPLQNNDFLDKYKYFKSTILNENLPDVTESLFQIEKLLHITLFCLKLTNKEHKLVSEVVESVFNDNSEFNDISLTLEKIDMMLKGNKAKNIYVQPSKCDNLEKYKDFVDLLIQKLLSNKLITKESIEDSFIVFNHENERYENKLIHCSLMNKNFCDSIPFDGHRILKKLRHFTGFGNITIDKLELRSFGNQETEYKKFSFKK